jgi:hypothetical protein
MDALGTIVSVIELSKRLIGFIKDVHEAPRERLDLLQNLSVLQSLLALLRERAQPQTKDQASTSFTSEPHASLRELGHEDGLLYRVENLLNELQRKLLPSQRKRKMWQHRLAWPFEKPDVLALVSSVERLNRLVSLALNHDIL